MFQGDAYFLGPKSENADIAEDGFQTILKHWFDWRRSLFPRDRVAISVERRESEAFKLEEERLFSEVRNLCDMLLAETPTYTPRYFGHMVSEISLPSLFGHFATLLHNPNNTSREVSKVGARMESEAVSMLAKMVGYDSQLAQGHFTCGGTISNFEAVWRARYRIDHALALGLCVAEKNHTPLNVFDSAHMGWDEFDRIAKANNINDSTMRRASGVLNNPYSIGRRISDCSVAPYLGPVLITPGNKHFSWRKAANIFNLGEEAFLNAPLDSTGRLDVVGLGELIERCRQQGRPILCVVTVAGTTEAGEIDPIDEVANLLDQYRAKGIHIWHHVDAAFGGFFCSMLGGDAERSLSESRASALRAMRTAESVTLDPHKLGYVPYACGAFLTKDERSYTASSFHAPYIDRADKTDKWRSTIEGSRTAAGAAATWLTGRTLRFDADRFGRMLSKTIHVRKMFEKRLAAECDGVKLLKPADTNILCFSVFKPGDRLSVRNRRTAYVFEKFQTDPAFAISKTIFDVDSYEKLINEHTVGGGVNDVSCLVLARCVFMNPFLANEDIQASLLDKFVARLSHYVSESMEFSENGNN